MGAVLTHESIVESAIAQYYSDVDFKGFVDAILARILVDRGVTISPEALLGQQLQAGVPMAVMIYKRYRATQIV
jgi:hypothetical protein